MVVKTSTPQKFIQAIERVILESPSRDSDYLSNKKLKIMILSVEASPFVRVGGVSSVVSSLAKELKNLGHSVCVFLPKFGFINEESFGIKTLINGLEVPTGDENRQFLSCNVKSVVLDDITFYFLENMEYYELRANVYGYTDDAIRWALLNRGAIEFIKRGIFIPDVIHCNDWQCGYMPNYLKTTYKRDPVLSNIAVVFTIHNLKYQGMFDHRNIQETDFDDGWSDIASFFDPRLTKQNFMRRGILYADVVSTVSKSYAKEISTPEYGEGLDKLISELREKIFGIINGIDYEDMNPAKDILIEKNYDIKSIDNRLYNKEALQKEFDLEINKDIPVLGFVGRLDMQKGVDLMVNVLDKVLKYYNAQFVQVGGGDAWLVSLLTDLKNKYQDKVGIHTYSNFTLPRLIFAGSDMIIYPSRFEPCGVVQLEAMRYGSIPIVRYVGGLKDTVKPFDTITQEGTGFVFKDFDEFALFGEIVRALEIYKNKHLWRKIQINAMKADFSWSYSAKEYEKLYIRAISNVRNKKTPK